MDKHILKSHCQEIIVNGIRNYLHSKGNFGHFRIFQVFDAQFVWEIVQTATNKLSKIVIQSWIMHALVSPTIVCLVENGQSLNKYGHLLWYDTRLFIDPMWRSCWHGAIAYERYVTGNFKKNSCVYFGAWWTGGLITSISLARNFCSSRKKKNFSLSSVRYHCYYLMPYIALVRQITFNYFSKAFTIIKDEKFILIGRPTKDLIFNALLYSRCF